jgi:D-arginine dehydrogenase
VSLPDVIVIGAGLAGTAVAWHLAPHCQVLLLERATQPGSEASAQNAGMVRRLVDDPVERVLACRTHDWLQEPGPDWEGRDPSRVVGAVLGLASDPLALHDAVAHLRSVGARVHALGKPEAAAPALAGAPLQAAWHLPDERVADAHSMLSGFLAGARRDGARVELGAQVESLVVEGGRCVGVRTRTGAVMGGAVVMAAGAWCAGLARLAGIERSLFPVRRTLVHSKAHPLSSPDHPWTWIDDAGLYFRPETGGWLMSPCDETIDFPLRQAGSSGPVTPEVRALLLDKLRSLAPALADARFVGGWSGLRTFAPDRLPLLGADPELPGLWWAAGLGGAGVSSAYAAAEVVALCLRGQAPDWLDLAAVSPARRMLRRWTIRPAGGPSSLRLVDGNLPSRLP